jgi:hypothetical protein
MSFMGYRNDGTIERRIGRRRPAPDIPVTWVVPRKGAFTLSRKPREYDGYIADVSLTGAAVIGPADMELRRGEQVILRWEGLDNSVLIRHTRPTEDAAFTAYGVELVVVHPKLQALIAETVERRQAEA